MRAGLRGLTAALLTLLFTGVLGVGQAAAKMPSSAVLTSVATGRDVNLEDSSPDHLTLTQILVLDGPVGALDPPEPMNERSAAHSVTVRWGFTDGGPLVQVDQVYPDTGDGMWVRSDRTPDNADDYLLWYRAPDELDTMLTRLGLLDPDELRPIPSASGGVPTDGWWWALPGLAAGVLLGFAARRGARRQLRSMPG